MDRLDRAAQNVLGLGVLVGMFLAAEAVVAAIRIPVPPAIGAMLALTVFLVARPAALPAVAVATPLLRILPLLFVPLVVGAAGHAAALGARIGPAAAVVLLSTLAAAVATGVASRGIAWICSRWR